MFVHQLRRNAKKRELLKGYGGGFQEIVRRSKGGWLIILLIIIYLGRYGAMISDSRP
ncbi:hypothetical protein SOVF_087500 [Spinacia oleracea]|nr:hypothetical protein SOVF_087500 [Spinacia oleracea]